MAKKAREATNVERRLFTVRETAVYLGVSDRTIYNGIARKTTKPFPVRPKRIGRAVRFDRHDLDRYLDQLGADE